MKYGISCKGLYSGDRWNNYQYRYNTSMHHDLIDVLSDFGASAQIKLNEACAVMGFPGKFGIDGSEINQYYDKNDYQSISNYCETDVLNTYLVYLRVMMHQHKLSIANYNYAIESILEFLQNSDKQYLLEFYQAWLKSCDGVFYINRHDDLQNTQKA